MSPRIALVPALAVLALLAAGCSQVLSRAALEKVDRSIDYAQVKANPDAYRGRTLLLAGLILDNRTGREGTTLELLHYFADHWGQPTSPDEAGGRFLVRSDHFLDPELYHRGLFVTLTATAAGEETRALQGRDYRYPLFTLGEAHLWLPPEPWQDWPGIPYYDPFAPWPYWYGPGWNRPWYGPGWGYPYPYGGSLWYRY